MTDTDVDYGPDDPSDMILRDQRATTSNVMTSLSDDPEKVSRAFELSEATGDKPALIYGNLENYETQHKAALTSQLLNSSRYLRQYADADPMHAKISNDDWANLDNLSQQLIKLPSAALSGLIKFDNTITAAAKKGFEEAIKESWDGSHLTDEELKNYPLASALSLSLQGVAGTFLGAPFKAITEAGGAAAEEGHKLFSGDPMAASIFRREISGVIESQLMGLSGYHGIARPTPEQRTRSAEHNLANREKVDGILRKSAPWIDAGKEPPRFLDPEIDKLKYEQNKIDLDNLDEALKASEASATRERNPEVFASFIRQHTDARIGISGDAVARLYGDKVPEVGDNILGWSPRIIEELEVARATGGDVHIPLADWLAKVDPEVAKELHDDIRVRPSGITKVEQDAFREAKEGIEEWKPADPLPEPIPSLRGSTSLEPLFSIGDRKLELKKSIAEKAKGFENFHDFDLLDEQGQRVGNINLSEQKGGKELYVEMIQGGPKGSKLYNPNSMGPSLMRDLVRQLKVEFPLAEWLLGHRVSGAREKAGSYNEPSAMVRIKLDNPKGWEVIEGFRQILEGGEWKSMGLGLEAYIKPTELFTKHERELSQAIKDELARIVPKQVDVSTLASIRRGDTKPRGVYTQYTDRNPFITVALDSQDPIGVARHEAIHHLRGQGFFKEGEWETLIRAARDEGWIEQFGIEKRYAKLEHSAKLEEAIADGYRAWKDGQETSPRAKAVFERLKEFFDSIRLKFKAILGRDFTWEELFQKVDEGEIGQREGNAPRREGAYKESVGEPELPHLTRIEDRDAFDKATAIGMTVDQYKRYMALIEKRHAEDLTAAKTKAEADQTKRQTKEWKTNEKELRASIKENISARPDIAADNYLSTGVLFGEKVKDAPKLDVSLLTEEQKAGLPKEYQSKTGMHPDDLAELFGYKSGQAMIEQLSALEAARKETKLSQKEFLNHIIDQETERQMQAKYGSLEKNILEEAKDQALSETQLSLLHEETYALATQAGLEFSLTKSELKRAVSEKFQDSLARDVSTDQFLRDAGKAGKAAEMSLLKGDYANAFREKQRQYLAISFANEAKAFEKAQVRFEKTAKRFGKREVKGVDQEYTNFIQDLLQKAGSRVDLSPTEIAAAIDNVGYSTLERFVEAKNGDGWELAVGDNLQAGRVKPLTEMSVGEFTEFKDAVDSLAYAGRRTKQINVAGDLRDYTEWKAEVRENIRTLPARTRENSGRIFYQMDASMTRTEEMIKDLDLRKELGPLFNAIIRPMSAAKTHEYKMIDDLVKRLREINGDFGRQWQKTLDDTIPQDFFMDHFTGQLFDLTRTNLIQIMLNQGTKSNKEKFASGWASDKARKGNRDETAAFQDRLDMLIDQHATKADWDYVQSIWNLFHDWQKEADVVHRNVSGVPPRWVEAEGIITPHGNYKGGYYPIIYDKLASNIAQITDHGQLLSPNYFRAVAAKGYTKERTGYADRIDIVGSLDQVAKRMQQMIHDISFREALVDVNKILEDREIRGDIRKHYGIEYEEQLPAWLRRVANATTQDEVAIGGINRWLRIARVNLVGHALPASLRVALSPDMGAWDPVFSPKFYANKAYYKELAMTKSQEIPHTIYNMDRDFTDALTSTIAKKGLSAYQADAMRWGYTPMVAFSQEFRMQTFAKAYEKGIAKGLSESEAAAIADSRVRERHGAASVVDLPAIMQSTEAMKTFTLFYGYYMSMRNWMRQIPGNIRRGEFKEAATAIYGSLIIPSIFGAAFFNQQKEGDSWFKTAAKAITIQALSTDVIGRVISSIAIEGYGTRTPIGTAVSALVSAANDIKRWQKNEPVLKPVQHAANVVGILGGVPGMAQVGRTGQFFYDVNKGRQRPRNIVEWARGIINGEARLKH